MSVSNVPETWPLGYVVVCPSCDVSHEVDEVDLADAAAHPYTIANGDRMFNFECPNCRTQNGVRYEDTSHGAAPVAALAQAPVAEVAEAVEAPPGEPVADGTDLVTGEATDEPYADGTHA